ncbi:hypothetical protein BDQ17DRAFT_1398901 [Cyathus striatus]|nr:hypothetical protein BDQ17DRAFT_1398901 [Cyathus striatus]
MEDVILPLEHPVRSNSHILVNGVGMVVDPVVGNPVLQNAMQIPDQLSDIGRVVPFVAPAFMLLKIIIDVEKRPKTSIAINSATRQVIKRMNDALKDAAALITAYRKQGFIARRLNISNREKFTICAEPLNTCCKDLVISLQIYQTDKLNILAREMPVDGQDEEARTFVASHGSIEEVTHSKELVEEFAKQQHLAVDDAVMEQLRTGLNDTIQRNQGLAAEMNALEAEQRFNCVQCNKEFRQSTNGSKACSFHRGDYDSWGKSYSCRGTANPCEFQGILNYVDTVDQWSSIEDTNLETDTIQKASVGKLLRWKLRGVVLDETTILITVGSVWYRYPYFFDTFTAKELQSVAAALSLTDDTLIFRMSTSDSEYAIAERILSSSSDIIGIRLTAKTATSSTPWVIIISEGSLRAYKPSSPYVLPFMVRFGPELNEEPVRAVHTGFRSHSSVHFPVLLKCSSNPPLSTNTQCVNDKEDFFEGVVAVFNDQSNGSQDIVTIVSASAFYLLVGDEEYLPASSCKIEEPQVPRRWWNRAFIARNRPVRIKLVLEGIYGEQCSLVMEYIYRPFKLPSRSEDDLGFFFFDSPNTATRAHISVERVTSGSGFIKFGCQEVSEKTLTKLVYNALETKITEVNLGIGQEKDAGEWEWEAYALIDLYPTGRKECKKQFGCTGYVLCPEYGRVVDHLRTVRYAVEKAKLPDLQPCLVESFATDDTRDDYVPEVNPSTISSTAGVHYTIPEELNNRLVSIDVNLSRIAIALELIAEKIGPT